MYTPMKLGDTSEESMEARGADPRVAAETARRRTFAIVSHPDAGKTTLTEKFLLYSGAVNLAGSVTARKNQRATTSDWMELEKQRGISISSTVLQFEYRGFCINLLDTPGHKDFSEDTYRVLTAVDAAVMVVDAGKGIESQTLKLFQVCRQRGVPIFTFMNKMDRPARDPLALLDKAIASVDKFRSSLGAVQNRLDSAITNLNNTTTNLSEAQSRIQDADYATEVSNMSKAQIIQQAGNSVLAKANQVPQQVLSLLQG